MRSYRGILLAGLAVIGAVGAVAPGCGTGSDGGKPTVTEVGSYLTELPPWPEPEPDQEGPAGEPELVDEVLEGVTTRCEVTPYSLTQTPDKIVALNPDAELFWPGVMWQGTGYRGGLGSLAELPIRQRAPLKVSINLLFGDNTRTVEDPDLASVTQAVGQIIEAASKSGVKPPSETLFNQVATSSVEQAALKMGLSARFLGSSIKAKLSAKLDSRRSNVTAYFLQTVYSVSVVPPQTPSGFFSEDFTAADLQQQVDRERIGSDNLPVYLSSVTYGRMLMYSFTSSVQATELQAAVNAYYKGLVAEGGASVSAKHRKILSEAETSVIAIGGDQALAEQLIATGNLSDYFAYSPDLSSYVPVSYTVRNLSDNSIALVSETTNYNVKTCVASKVGAPRDGLVLEYLFNDSEVLSAGRGRTPDSSGQGNHGSFYSSCTVAPTPDRFNLADSAYDFRGRGSCDAADPSLIYVDAPGYSSAFSYALWLKGTCYSNGCWVIGQRDGAALTMDYSRVSFGDPDVEQSVVDETDLARDEWVFLVATVSNDGGNTEMRLYRNAAQVGQVTFGGALPNRYASPTLIGNRRGGADVAYPGRSGDYQGTIDDVRVYDRALEQQEIAALYALAADR